MSREHDAKHDEIATNSRRFTTFELFVYMSAVCFTFATFKVYEYFGPLISGVIFVGGIGALGSLVGVPVAL